MNEAIKEIGQSNTASSEKYSKENIIKMLGGEKSAMRIIAALNELDKAIQAAEFKKGD